MTLALLVVFYALALAGAFEALRRLHALAAVVFLALPPLLTPLWLREPHAAFMWFKIYSVIAGAAFVLACRTTRLGRRPRALLAAWAILAANILEAVALDLTEHQLASALAGVVLIASIHTPRAITIAARAPRDFTWDLSRSWILAYTVWNWVFVYLHWPAYAGIQTPVLLAPLLLGMALPGRWFEARAYTFAAHMIVAFTRWSLFDPLQTPGWAGWPLAAALPLASVACALGAGGLLLRQRLAGARRLSRSTR